MGFAAVADFVRCGFRVFALDIKNIDATEGVIPIACDVTDPESVREAFATVSSYTSALYSIVHFAGIYMLDSLVEISEESFDKILKVNLYGAYYVNKCFLSLLSPGSRILITTSELAPLDPLPFTGIYAVTKAALDQYAYSLRMELQLLGISVSVLRAGAVDTGMLGTSTRALDKFCDSTELYTCNAERFRDIVMRVEARCITADKLSAYAVKLVQKKKPGFAYKINRNPLLLLLNLLPKRLQLYIIKRILRKK